MSTHVPESPPGTSANNESDTNADTCCLGTNFIILQYTRRSADVYPYDTSYQPTTQVPIVTGATAWTDPSTETTYILVFNESLYFGPKLDHSLINPNQLRYNGVTFCDNPFDHMQDLSLQADRGPVIPLHLQGTKIIFKSRVPTKKELSECEHIEMTNVHPWNPETVILGEMTSSTSHKEYDYNINVMISKAQTTRNPYSTEEYIKHEFVDPRSDECILHDINPSLIKIKELLTDAHNDVPIKKSMISRERHKSVTAQSLSELWGIGLKRAESTLTATTQTSTRSATLPLSRRYRADRMYRVKRLDGKFATDTMYADIKSLKQNSYAQVFTHKIGFAACYPLDKANGDTIGYALQDFIHDFGAPYHLTFDGASVQVGKKTRFMTMIRQHQILYHVSGPRRPNENPAEGMIREVKKRWYRIMSKKKVPKRLWDYGLVWICETGNLTVSSSRYSNGRTPIEIITGETPDISEHLDFGFYDWCTYRPNSGLGDNSIGRWLGVSHKVGQSMSYWILTISGHVISCTTVQRLTNAEMQTDEWKSRMSDYDEKIKDRLEIKDSEVTNHSDQPQWNRLSTDEDDPEFIEELNKVINDDTIKDEEEPTPDTFDAYLNMELGLPRGDDDALCHATVKRRAVDKDGKPIGIKDNNPLLDTRQYEVEFLDGTTETLTANTIAENLLAQVDEEGHRQLLLDEIIDHRKGHDAINKEDGFTSNEYNQKRKIQTTKGWELCVCWKDGSTNWVPLKDLKNAYPVQLAEYAINNEIQDEPAFAWWVPYTIKKRKSIISKIKSKYWQRTHKYGIRIPKSVKEAYDIDKTEGNTYWHDAIEQEMVKIRQAMKEYNGDPSKLVGYQEITTHFVFDIKLGENFRRKARLVADGHKTSPPSSVTYSSVVSRDSVRICLLLAALNELDVLSADIENAYLTAPCREKCWTRAGPEFGSDEGKPFIVTQALYGLKSSGAAFRAFLAETLDDIGFKSSIADPDVWMRAAVKPDGEEYYEYILVYVDDILAISHEPKRPMHDIQKAFKFKKDEIKAPDTYLGAKLEEKSINGRKVWTMTSRDYVKHAVKNVEDSLKKRGMKLQSKASTPMGSGYKPELDASEELDADDVTFFQELIGILRWAIEIGRVDIHTEVSMLSSYQASPRMGHLEQVIHIFAYLKKKPKLTLYFDPEEPILDHSMFQGSMTDDFKQIYRDAKEETPNNAPRPRGRRVTTTAFVDASHASCRRTRRSHTGFILFVNRAPITWYSKRQNTIESSTFSSEFIAMKTCMEAIVGLRYKLRMFGVPINGPTKVLCDNQGVVDNSSKIESMLNKKHNSIAYHAVRWAVAAGTMMVGKVDTEENIADAMTKRLTVMRRDKLFGNWTY